jgi:hypothetical protein
MGGPAGCAEWNYSYSRNKLDLHPVRVKEKVAEECEKVLHRVNASRDHSAEPLADNATKS